MKVERTDFPLLVPGASRALSRNRHIEAVYIEGSILAASIARSYFTQEIAVSSVLEDRRPRCFLLGCTHHIEKHISNHAHAQLIVLPNIL